MSRAAWRGERSKRKRKMKGAMNTLQLKGNWNVAKGKLKQKFAQLTDDDVQCAEGLRDELMGRIQKRMAGRAREAKESGRERVIDEECFCSR